MQAAFAELERSVAEFERQRPQLKNEITSRTFLETIRQLEAIQHLGSRIQGYASLAFAADTQSQPAQAFLASVEGKMAELENFIPFPACGGRVGRSAASPAGGSRRLPLLAGRDAPLRRTPFGAEEKIVNIKNSRPQRPDNLYDAITNRYVFRLTVDGEEKELTRGEIMVYARGHDPEQRLAAYQELYRVYGQDGPVLGLIYQTLVRDWRNEQVDLRHFISPIAARNLVNDIPDDVVDTLLQVCERNATIFQRYFRLKARLLCCHALRRYALVSNPANI
jgi:oligoendopeptidase F